MSRRWGRLEPRSGDRLEFRVVDASLARALYDGIPAARLLARARPIARRRRGRDVGVGRAPARAARRLLRAGQARDGASRAGRPRRGAAPRPARPRSRCSHGRSPRLRRPTRRSPRSRPPRARPRRATRACSPSARRTTRAWRTARPTGARPRSRRACASRRARCSGRSPWDRVRAIATQLERAEIGVRLLGDAPGVDLPAPRRRRDRGERSPHDGARPRAARRARREGSAPAGGDDRPHGPRGRRGRAARDLPRRPRAAPRARRDDRRRPARARAARRRRRPRRAPALHPAEWTASTAAALADALERGATTFPRVRAAAVRGGEAALDAIGAEMLDVGVPRRRRAPRSPRSCRAAAGRATSCAS